MASLFEHVNVGDTNSDNLYDVRWIGQNFIASSNYKITSVKFYMKRTAIADTYPLVVSLYLADGAGKPTGAALASGVLDCSSLSTSTNTWIEISYGAGAVLSSGTRYVHVMNCITPGAGYLLPRYRNDSYYPNGQGISSWDSGATWSVSGTNDYLLENWGSPLSISPDSITNTIYVDKPYLQTITRKWFLFSSTPGGSGMGVPAGNTFRGAVLPRWGGNSAGSDSNYYVKVHDSYVIKKPRFYVHSNTINNTSTYTLRKNGANTQISCIVPPLTTGIFSDDLHSELLSSNDGINNEVIADTGTGNIYFRNISLLLQASHSKGLLNCTNQSATLDFGETKYLYITGEGYRSAEAMAQVPMRKPGTHSKLRLYVVTNSLNGNYTLTSRINGNDGSLSVTVPAGTTGEFTDYVNSDSFAAADKLNYKVVASGTVGNSFLFNLNSMLDCIRYPYVCALIWDADAYAPVLGGESTEATSEDYVQTPVNYKTRMGDLYVYGQDGTVKTRINKADGKISVTLPGGGYGGVEDVVNTDSLVETDLYNYYVDTNGANYDTIFAIYDNWEPSYGGSNKTKLLAAGLI